MDSVPIDQIWHITAEDPAALVVAAKVQLPPTNKGAIAARALVQALREGGLLTDFVVVLEADQTLKVVKATPVPKGKYGKYLSVNEGQVLTKEALDIAIASAQPEATANHEKLVVNIGDDDGTQHAPITIDGEPLAGPAGSSTVVASSYGPRYASRDVLTYAGAAQLGDGLSVDTSLTKGLPGLRTDSKGGDYVGFTGAVSQATVHGLFTARFSHSDFKVGGVNRPLHQTGNVDKVSIEWSRPASADPVPFLRLENTRQSSWLLGTFSDTLSNTAVIGGVQYQKMLPDGGVSADLSIEQGLHQNRTVHSPTPLLGETDPTYTAMVGNFARLYVYKDWAITSKAGFQLASTTTPASSQLYDGGPDRGSASNTGIFAGASGAYASVQAVGPSLGPVPSLSLTSVKPMFGLDGGFVKTIGGPVMSESAVSTGLQLGANGHFNASVSLSIPLKDSSHSAKPRIGMFLQTNF